MNLPKLKIGNLELKLPIIQGGMGIGVSRSKLAAAIAKEGGLGVISAAQVGYEEEDFYTNTQEANIRALENEIQSAKEMSNNKGLIGVNIMVATKNYADMVKASIRAKADVIISGAGLPTELPRLVKDTPIKIVPIVSSLRATKIIIKKWLKQDRYPDAIVVEGPKAGGHLGFKPEELRENIDFKKMINEISDYVATIKEDIPVIAAGGIYSGRDISEYLKMGAKGVQMSTRFVTTDECDAHEDYKKAYIDADKEDIVIVKSPVGLPGRAIRNDFIKKLEQVGKEKISNCYQCLKGCNPVETPYCITSKLINAVKGNIDDGLIFVGANAWKNQKIETVKEVIEQIKEEYNSILAID